MKKLMVTVCAVSVFCGAVQAFAALPAERKNIGPLYGKNCPKVVDSLPERIAKLKIEIAKGDKVYSPDELKLLERKLKEDNQTMRSLHKPGK
ncbi:hypothetical protein FO488_12290 [Geobacter sp. FeAm09]|uniref:hypothetical protein n=1 Tax=Geobacter sp. FeAm09 TaxID=2597769 RepID=UPI0011EBCE82|nr:hypothetical protein [Geobacter sp. FeAm09]QEM68857.1 hypothetical protein FO488_12290 [Geobacter sp. FeAm09]